MAYHFNLWNFYKSADRVCEFDVTAANMPRMKDATREWIEDCFAAFELKASVSTWEVRPFRSHYFSSYPDEDDWQDRWTRAWNVSVVTQDEIPDSHLKLEGLPRKIESPDPTWSSGFVDPRHEVNAMLISNFRSETAKVVEIEQAVLAAARSEDLLATKPVAEIRSVDKSIHQLRILFEAHLPECVAPLEGLLESCRKYDGITNWAAWN